ncbi:Uncharacterised protein [Mycobacteroides abscessus subsp. massiliense]|uniref:Uncharacterized protein n=1 Tax=Mycobacteroides abscessus MAB_091912_2446 TaxID=1335414 RepID=A0A829M7M5_9MYCO|nr:hypothetical protein MM1S1520914_1221 [Mycobacteroides abscessus subsp. bolletii 1S-152-0914]EIU86101.1 hypothetical protein MM2B0626_0845 [Mycobacteroides abscessus subsp. bolletii 2B-0626]EIV14484.1 hypothetical protein MM2B0912R_1245 [Mycobacteroides abscessus subsp. bolletii 2B-0912-R]EIV27154.1 hypothetical protein MM2B0912S_0844 [Mycobacteroides abscessus subsp. bolletii 2B-0912-S]EIV80564.1 hypothetical protein MM2B1231_0904 [Mycobacteroides abscessus subsp. bolletii 2B-1231]EIV80791
MFCLDNAVLAFRFTATVIGGRALPWPVCRYQPGQQSALVQHENLWGTGPRRRRWAAGANERA